MVEVRLRSWVKYLLCLHLVSVLCPHKDRSVRKCVSVIFFLHYAGFIVCVIQYFSHSSSICLYSHCKADITSTLTHTTLSLTTPITGPIDTLRVCMKEG